MNCSKSIDSSVYQMKNLEIHCINKVEYGLILLASNLRMVMMLNLC